MYKYKNSMVGFTFVSTFEHTEGEEVTDGGFFCRQNDYYLREVVVGSEDHYP